MSENVLSLGVMVPLDSKITNDQREEWSEILWEQGSNVKLSYYCDMAYTEERGDEYGISFGDMPKAVLDDFKDLKQFGIVIEKDKARSYRCFWYNGSDSDMDMMTKEKFLSLTRQE